MARTQLKYSGRDSLCCRSYSPLALQNGKHRQATPHDSCSGIDLTRICKLQRAGGHVQDREDDITQEAPHLTRMSETQRPVVSPVDRPVYGYLPA